MRSERVQKLQGDCKKTPDSLHPVYTDPKATKKKQTELPFSFESVENKRKARSVHVDVTDAQKNSNNY